MGILAAERKPMLTTIAIVSLISLSLVASLECQNASACQCGRLEPVKYYEGSDVIFVGKVTNIEKLSLEQGRHVTFAVLKSWKGVDTKIVTIRTGDGTSCGSFPFRGDDPEQEYLVYGVKEFSEIQVSLCGGTTFFDPYVDRDLKYLGDNFSTIELRQGHTTSVNIFPLMQILGGFVAVAIVAFVAVRRF